MTKLSWIDPDTADLVELDVPEDAAERIARGEPAVWYGDDPTRTTAQDCMLNEIIAGYPSLKEL